MNRRSWLGELYLAAVIPLAVFFRDGPRDDFAVQAAWQDIAPRVDRCRHTLGLPDLTWDLLYAPQSDAGRAMSTVHRGYSEELVLLLDGLTDMCVQLGAVFFCKLDLRDIDVLVRSDARVRVFLFLWYRWVVVPTFYPHLGSIEHSAAAQAYTAKVEAAVGQGMAIGAAIKATKWAAEADAQPTPAPAIELVPLPRQAILIQETVLHRQQSLNMHSWL